MGQHGFSLSTQPWIVMLQHGYHRARYPVRYHMHGGHSCPSPLLCIIIRFLDHDLWEARQPAAQRRQLKAQGANSCKRQFSTKKECSACRCSLPTTTPAPWAFANCTPKHTSTPSQRNLADRGVPSCFCPRMRFAVPPAPTILCVYYRTSPGLQGPCAHTEQLDALP